ncbi:Trk system potassium transporter TrkA [Paraliomyxa miuraensis]|uniref:Trk system potassium transporter TrkA n=1 Tax=Paraliomyxa miuraensis TaxID=376150 RepID=UPI002259BBAA|nr:Trk system potassium transporter TrkA [Paraliomyxa miuraensis]MCX4246908.1 Trk system potassium transporter TrkA [Paraliomyxa miuraensis]
MRALILGAGEAGRFLAASLSEEAEVVLVDDDADALAEAEETLDVQPVRGNATHRAVLERAEARKADVAVAVTGHDAVNVAAAVMAKTVGVGSTIARVDDPGFYKGGQGLERNVAGIDACICASRLVGRELLRLVSAVEVSFSASLGGGAAHVALIGIDDSSPLRGESPTRLKVRMPSAEGSVVRAVLRGGTPRAASEIEALEEGDRVLAVASPLAVTALVQHSRAGLYDRVTLIGGGDVGLQLATMFASLGSNVRLVDTGRGRCEELAAKLGSNVVLHGDGTSLRFLRDERIGLSDCVMAVTGSDEVNLMSSLLTRELGVERTFALVHRPGYTSVYEHLGIAGTTSAHEVMAQTLHGLLPGRELVEASTIAGTDLELLELRVPPLRRPVPVRSLPLGPGALVVAVIVHDQSTRLRDPGERGGELHGGEHVVAIAPSHHRRDILRALRGLAKHKDGHKEPAKEDGA